ncbi:MAG: hypothetical protein JRN09_03475 [Nitrososphaerota archaeon]|nr:hypothetical protein [Nitrososphaerota archaeon]
MDPFVVLDQSVAQGKLKPAFATKVRSRARYLTGAVSRVEKASGIAYPPYYVEPSLPVATSSVEFGSVGALYARVIPASFEGRLSIIVQFTAPLLLFGLKGTIEAVAAHEFTHYIDLVRRFSQMQLSSDERASTLYEAGYADEERLVEPASVLGADKKLVALVRKKFAAGLVDEKLNEKVAGGWIEKGLPTKRVSPEENAVSVSVATIANTSFDPAVIAKIAELGGRKQA